MKIIFIYRFEEKINKPYKYTTVCILNSNLTVATNSWHKHNIYEHVSFNIFQKLR